jgi:hypothetical protein
MRLEEALAGIGDDVIGVVLRRQAWAPERTTHLARSGLTAPWCVVQRPETGFQRAAIDTAWHERDDWQCVRVEPAPAPGLLSKAAILSRPGWTAGLIRTRLAAAPAVQYDDRTRKSLPAWPLQYVLDAEAMADFTAAGAASARRAEKTAKAAEQSTEEARSRATRVPWPTAPGISVSVATDIVIHAPYNAALVAACRACRGTWDATIKCWRLPLASLDRIEAEVLPALTALTERARQAADADRAAAQRTEAALREIRWPASFRVTSAAGRLVVGCAFDPDTVAELRALSGTWCPSQRQWSVPASSLDALKTLADAHHARQAAEHAQTDASSVTSSARTRLVPASSAPAVGALVSLFGKIAAVAAHGRRRRITEDDPSVHGSHLLGHEGDQGVVIELRDPTPAEITAYEARIRAADEATAALSAFWCAWSSALSSATLPPQDELDAIQAFAERLPLPGTAEIQAYGGGTWLARHGTAVYVIQGYSSDGDDWSHQNWQGCVVRRLPTADFTHLRDLLARVTERV